MQRRLGIVCLLALIGGAVVGAGQGAQPPVPQTPAFKSQVEYVEVDVLVSDQQGRFVSDLKKEDFEVREDGKAQTISTFALVNIPVEREERPLFAGRAIEPDVQTNARPFDGRVYVMVLDDYHTDVMRTPRVKSAARRFIEKNLGANDLMAIVTVGGGSDAAQEFTSSRRLLLAAVNRFMGQKLQSATLARNEEFFRGATQPSIINDPEEFERLQRARNSLRTIKEIAEWFGGVHGRRKTILLISEGIDYDITDLIPSPNSTHRGAADVIEETREAVGAAQRSNVSIYALDPRGLITGAEDAIGVSNFADSPALAPDPSAAPSARPDIGLRSLRNEVRASQDSLRTLAEETGGLALVDQNNYVDAFDRIVGDNSSYYLLAYYPPSDKRDGKLHKIDVRVKRPGLSVRARRGYMAPRGKPPIPLVALAGMGASPSIREAMGSPLPVSGLTMQLFTAPFKGVAPNASVLFGVELRGRDLNLSQSSAVEFSYSAIDVQGKLHGTRINQMKLNLRPETRARVEQTGIRLLNRIDLPPGRYRLHVASHDTAGGAVGSVIADIEVPDFYKVPFSMSGLVVTSLAGASIPTPRGDDQLKEVLPSPPISLRVFPPNDELALFTEVYDNSGSTPHRVDIVTTVTADAGTVVFKNEEERESSELQGKRGGYGYAARVPLSGLPAGLYVLKVEARSRLGQRTAAREIQFSILAAQR